MTPLLIFLGLTPAQAVSTGKFNGLAAAVGSLSGLSGYKGKISKGKIAFVMSLALIIGLLVPLVIKSFDNRWYRITLGIILLLMIPLMIYKKVGIKPSEPSAIKKGLGGVSLAISLFLQGMFSGGLGSLVNIVLMGMLGQTAVEANITKRWSQLIMNVTIIFGLLTSGLIIWPAAILSTITGFAGGYIGGRLAIQKGDTMVINVMLILMLVSGLILIFGAL